MIFRLSQQVIYQRCLGLIVGILLLAAPYYAIAAEKQPNRSHFINGGLAWSPDGSLLAVGAADGVWIHSGTDLAITDHLPNIQVTALGWNPRKSLLAVGGQDGRLQIWNLDTHQVQQLFAGKNNVILDVEWSPNGRWLAAADREDVEEIKFWDLEKASDYSHIVPGTPVGFEMISWDPTSSEIVTLNNGIQVYDVQTQRLVDEEHLNLALDPILYANPHSRDTVLGDIKWSPDGKWFAITDTFGVLHLWDVNTKTLIKSIQMSKSNNILFTMTWTPDSKRLATLLAGQEHTGILSVVDIATGSQTNIASDLRIEGSGYYLNAVAWTADGSKLASISDNGKVFIWDGNTYKQLAECSGYYSSFELN